MMPANGRKFAARGFCVVVTVWLGAALAQTSPYRAGEPVELHANGNH